MARGHQAQEQPKGYWENLKDFFWKTKEVSGEVSSFIWNSSTLTKTSLKSFFLSTLTVGFDLISPYLLSQMINHASNLNQDEEISEDWDYSYFYGLCFTIAYALKLTLPSISERWSADVKTDVSSHYGLEAERVLTQKSLDYHLATSPGQIVTIFQQVYKGEGFIPATLNDIIPSVLEIICATGIMFKYDPELASIFLGTQFLNLLLISTCLKSTQQAYRDFNREASMLYRKKLARAERYEQMHMYTAVNEELKEAKSEFIEYGKILKKVTTVPATTILKQNLLLAISFFFTLNYALQKSQEGDLSFVSFVTFIIYLIQTIPTTSRVGKVVTETGHYVITLKDSIDYAKTPAEIKDVPTSNSFELTEELSTIRFQNVEFKTNDTKILNNLNLEIKAGQKVALVGLSGAGKSVIHRLLMRFYEPSSGDIFINNTNVKNISLYDLRTMIGVVPQTPVLINASLRENLRYAKPDATDQELKKILQSVSLDKKLDDNLGERGLRLSGGERQRLAIARILLRKDQMFFCILDEATTGLDADNMLRIQALLNQHTKNMTTLFITHHLLTTRNADQIILIDSGEIKEQGTFEELIEKKGNFHKMFAQYCEANGLILGDIIKQSTLKEAKMSESVETKAEEGEKHSAESEGIVDDGEAQGLSSPKPRLFKINQGLIQNPETTLSDQGHTVSTRFGQYGSLPS